MIKDIKPYPVYKETGVEWLGEVPEHWEIRRLKETAIIIAGQSPPSEIVSEYREDFPFLQGNAEFGRMCPSARLACETPPKWAKNGDILLSVRAPVGALNFADQAYGIGRGLCAIRPLPGVRRIFIYHTLGIAGQELLRLSTGSTYDAVTVGIIGGLTQPLPPLSEQTVIIRFLDHADRRIQRYIRAKQKLLTLLEEQKQAIIHQVVTGQIDVRTGKPYPAYKPSGLAWLGNVPEHWEMRKLGQIGRFSRGVGGNKEDEVPEGIPCVRYGDLYTSHTNFIDKGRSCVSKLKATEYTPIEYGDILFAASGETMDEIGKSAVNLLTSDAVCGGDVILLRLRFLFDARYMGYVTNCRPVTTQKSTMGRGITVMHIYANHLKYVTIPLPPLPEQTAIARHLDHATADIDSAISYVKRKIHLLNEYRTRLVADLVTGKLDVRQVAANLSEEQGQAQDLDRVR